MKLSQSTPTYVFALALTFILSNSLYAQTTQWIDHRDGFWGDSSNWSNGAPGATSEARIRVGKVTQNNIGGATVKSLTFDFSTSDLILETDLTITDHFFWDSGEVIGPAKLILTGTALVEDGRLTGTVDSTADVTVTPFVFFNGAGGDGVWNNLSGAKFNLGEDADLAFDSQFNNNTGAVIRKLDGSTESRFNWNLNSTGLIAVDGGRLSLLGNSIIDGEINIATGGTLDLGTIKDFTFGANAVINGGGVFEVSAGDMFVDHTLNVNSNMRLDGTSEIYGSGTINVNGFLDWDSSNKMKGTGVTNVYGDSLITGGGLERTLNNHGYVDFQPFTFLAGTKSTSVWNNKSGAVLDITNDQGFAFTGRFNNEAGAIFRKSAGTGTSSISWDFYNYGVIDAGSGTMRFTGDFFQGASGEIRLNGGTVDITDSNGTFDGSFSGAGIVDMASARVTGHLTPGNSPGTLEFTGDLELTGSAEINFELGSVSDLVIVGGDLTLDGTLNIFGTSGFGVGEYLLFDYEGTLVDNGLEIGTAPSGFYYEIITDTANSQIRFGVSVPEPSTVALCGLVAVGLFTRRRRI
ncbi:MAG: PEP-CTERM sorting domain-containing protein [Mariniblastus sp.]